ncbi:GDP-fucose transporter 1 [Orchesella cincta]|uniref:GDP-fucose transporter 1 n=1 Tax=Orchesella cincta TaxID=48709 RepID=A0A1D2NML8_ORCCI|nr:GDP-fucose transporter 1 [Orchesella cincta]
MGSSREKRDSALFNEYLFIGTVVAAYWVISIGTVFVNKSLLSQQQDFDAPMFVTWFQCVFTFLVCVFLTKFRRCLHLATSIDFPDIKINLKTMLRTLPLSIVFVAMITFNNLCLKHVGVAFYYLARSLTTVTNVAFTFVILRSSVTNKAILCCVIITIGYLIGIDQEGLSGGITTYGIVYGLLSSCFVSLNSIYTKKVLPAVDNSVWALTLYNNFNASLLFLPLMFMFQELPHIIFVSQIQEFHFWMLMLLGGVCGVCIGSITGLQIKVTSPLTHNISGTAKACVQTVIAVWMYNDSKSSAWWASNWIVLFGSGAYTKVQQLDMEKEHRRKYLPTHKTDVEVEEKLIQTSDYEDNV